VPGDQRLQLAHDLGVAAEGEPGLDPQLDRRHSQLFQAADLLLGERLVREVVERSSPPQGERLVERRGRGLGAAARELVAPLGQPALEAPGVELVRADPEEIARGRRDQRPAVAERLAQP
jgi:hypothetical protein